MELKSKLAAQLKVLRESTGQSQSDIAGILGVKVGVYQHYEHGRCYPPLHHLATLASIYGMTIDEMIACESPKPNKLLASYLKASPDKKEIVDFILKI